MTASDPRDLLAACPWCGEALARVMLINPEPHCGEILRQTDYGDDGLEAEAHAFCHSCGAQCAPIEVRLYTADDYDEAIAMAASGWNRRQGAEDQAAAMRANARRYMRLLHEGLRFMAGGKVYQTKAETDAAIDALPEPPDGWALRM